MPAPQEKRIPIRVTLYGLFCGIFGLTLCALLLAFGSARNAYAFTYDGIQYPDDLYGVTVTMRQDLQDVLVGYYEIRNQWMRVDAVVTNCPSGDTVKWLYFEASQTESGTPVAHPWYFYTSNIQSLTASSEGGARLAYDGGALGWWGTNSNMPATISFAPLTQSTNLSVIQTMTNHDFIRYIVDNSDYWSRYSNSGGSIAPTTWSNGSAIYNPGTRSVTVTTPSTNGSNWSCIIWTATTNQSGQYVTNWIYPDGATGASDAPSRYGTVPFIFTATVDDEAYGLLRVRWYYTLDGSTTQQTQTLTLVQDLLKSPYNPGTDINTSQLPFFEYATQEFNTLTSNTLFKAKVGYADSVVLQYTLDSGSTWITLDGVTFSDGVYSWTGKLPVSGVVYRWNATNSYGSVQYDYGIVNGPTTGKGLIDVFGQLAQYVQSFFNYMSSFFGWLPEELQTFLIIAVIAMITLGVVQLVKP